MQKRKYDSSDSKRRLLKAGLDIFSREGYDGATTRRIAKRAEVNEALIQRYFTSKLGLFFAIMHEFHQRIAVTPPYPAGGTLHEELESFTSFRVGFSRKHRKFLRLGIARAIVDKKVREELSSLVRNGNPGLLARLEALRAAGKIRADVSLEHVTLLVSCVTFSISMFTEILFKLDPDFMDEVRRLATRVLADGLVPR